MANLAIMEAQLAAEVGRGLLADIRQLVEDPDFTAGRNVGMGATGRTALLQLQPTLEFLETRPDVEVALTLEADQVQLTLCRLAVQVIQAPVDLAMNDDNDTEAPDHPMD